jgi:flagellar protein FlaG
MEVVTSFNSSGSSGSYSAPAPKTDTAATHAAAAKIADKPSAVPQKVQDALASLDLPDVADGSARVELNFNQDTGRVVAKVTDRISGDVLREIPSKELQQLFSQMREYLGSFVDEEI